MCVCLFACVWCLAVFVYLITARCAADVSALNGALIRRQKQLADDHTTVCFRRFNKINSHTRECMVFFEGLIRCAFS